MKYCLTLLILIFVCQIAAQTSLTVTAGSGDGTYRGQGFPDIWADPATPGTVFAGWSGDTHLLERPDEWHTRVKTGVRRINLTANYRATATWAPSSPEAAGSSQMRYYFPTSYVGVVFHFHGSGGSMNALYTQVEQTFYARELVDAGYAVVTINSADRVSGQWSQLPAATNPDIANIQSALATFRNRGWINTQTPVFASGSSFGGGFAPEVAYLFGFRGTAIFIATSSAPLVALTGVPMIWNIMQNDTTLAPGSVQTAFQNYSTLRSRGVRAEYNVLKPSPVFSARFKRIPGVTDAQSLAIYNALKSNNFLDSRDYLRANPKTSGWEAVIPPVFSSIAGDIGDQLWVCYAEHQFFSDHNRRVIRFFDSLR